MTKSSIKTFNTTGPCVPSEHYMLPVLARQPEVDEMIEGKFYFIIHAPRQSGKTTFLDFLTDQINFEGSYYAINCSLMTLRDINDRTESMTALVSSINQAMASSTVAQIKEKADTYNFFPGMNESNRKVRIILNKLCEGLDKELVVFFDEADCMSGDGLITFLGQIREAYQIRHKLGNKFPRSMALVGMRDIRDYLVQVRTDLESRGLASPFNIKKEALTLANFTKEEIGILYHQHTEASGQIFEPLAIDRAWYWSEGQPWLVNALAYQAVVKILKKNYSSTVTADIIDQSAEELIKRRDTHIDSLLERLKETRVINIMDSVLAGTKGKVAKNDDDQRYCLDLGLVVLDENGNLRPANAIYREVMSRLLTDQIQSVLDDEISKIKWTDGRRIFMNELLKMFQTFWRNIAFIFPLRINTYDSYITDVIKQEFDSLPLAYDLSEEYLLSFIIRVKDAIARQYDEAAYSLLLLAYLQKVVNGGALVFRQFAQGRGAVDICILFKDHEYLLECKLFGQKPREDSLKQLKKYLDTSGEKEGWLVIFDRSQKKSWEEKITWETLQYEGATIHIVGC